MEALITDLRRHKYEEAYYYEMRNSDRLPFFKRWNRISRASRFIYLNKTCYNGLFRVNSNGQFNTPFGRYTNPTIVDAENLRACSKALAKVKIFEASFDTVAKRAKPGDFVYFDPPYAPLSDTAYFTSYSKDGFGMDMQVKLRDVCRALNAKGIKFLLSNSAVPFILDLYSEFNVDVVYASRAVNSKADRRGKNSGGASHKLQLVTLMPIAGGCAANKQGRVLESTILPCLQGHGFEVVKYSTWVRDPSAWGNELVLHNVPYNTIYNHRGFTEFLLLSEKHNLKIRIECKWQQSGGSVDEKLPYLYLNCIETIPEASIFIIVGGGGMKKGAVEWLKNAVTQRLYQNDKTPERPKDIRVLSLEEFLTWANRNLRR